MIRVACHLGGTVLLEIDADDGIILDGSPGLPSSLVLSKGDEEVAWFAHWNYAIKIENLKEEHVQ